MSITPFALVSLGGNARTISAAKGLPISGFIHSVQPVVNPQGPHGRSYVRAVVTTYSDGQTPASEAELSSKTVAVLWAGYVCVGCPPSLPAYALTNGLSLVLDWTEGSNGAATDELTVFIDSRSESPTHAPMVWFEAPGQGPGELTTITQPGGGKTGGVGEPNSGASGGVNHKLLPAGVRWRFLGVGASLATSAVAGNREPNIDIQSVGGAEFTGGGSDSCIPPSTTVNLRLIGGSAGPKTPQSTEANTYNGATGWAVRGTVSPGPFPGQTPNFNALGAVAGTGFFWIWRTWNIDLTATTGDVYTGVRFGVEEWACPTP